MFDANFWAGFVTGTAVCFVVLGWLITRRLP